MPPSARAVWRDDFRSGLLLQAGREWNNCVDEELRRELLARRDEDQRILTAVRSPKGQYTVPLPDEAAARWQGIDEDNTRWLGEVLHGQGWPGRALVGEYGAAAAWLLAQHADRDPVRQQTFLQALPAQSIRARRLRLTWPIWRTGCGSMLASLSCTAPSSPSPTENSDPGRLRIRNGWISAARKPDLNHSLITKPECEPTEASTNGARQNALTCPRPVTLTCRMDCVRPSSGHDHSPLGWPRCK
jgi:hypothetical protein